METLAHRKTARRRRRFAERLLLVLLAAPRGGAALALEQERVNLGALTYAYRLCGLEHDALPPNSADRSKRPFFWVQDEIIKLLDADRNTAVTLGARAAWSASFNLENPLLVSGVSLSAAASSPAVESPRPWQLVSLQTNGPGVVVARGTLHAPEERCLFAKPIPLKRFRLNVAAGRPPDGSPDAGTGADVRLNDFSLWAPRQVAGLRIAPSACALLDPGFFPYRAATGQSFRLRAWTVFSTGEIEDHEGALAWRTSDPSVLQVADDGRVRTRAPGRATITGMTGDQLGGSLTILVEDPGTVDLDILSVDRWIRRRDGRLVKRPWDDETPLPQAGEKLVYRAQVINAGTRSCPRLMVQWWVDGAYGGQRMLENLAPAGELVETGQTTVDRLPLLKHEHEESLDFLEMNYDGKRHRIAVQVDSLSGPDSNPDNNQLVVWSDALAFGFFMDESAYHAYSRVQVDGWEDLPAGFTPPHHRASWAQAEWSIRSSTAHDMVQRFVRVFNRQFELSTHRLTPQGITERLNGRLFIVPDMASDRRVNGVCARFGDADRTLDLVWGHFYSEHADRMELTRTNLLSGFHQGRLPYLSVAYIHEVGHARYLVDLYGAGIHGDEIFLLDEGGRRVFPDSDQLQYDRTTRMGTGPPRSCIMMGDYLNGWCEHSAYAWERVRGRRARGGSWNAPPSIGEYLNVIPQSNIIRIVTPDGRPADRAQVQIFQSKRAPWGKRIYPKIIDNQADLTLTTDARGEAALGSNPFVSQPDDRRNPKLEEWHPKHIDGNAHINAIVKITWHSKTFYKFLTVLDSNLGYWNKYGLQPSEFPDFKIQPDTTLTYEYTIDPSWDAEQERAQRAEKPRVK